MILLGAGASKIFGLKTLQDLTNDLIDRMREKGHEETITTMISALKRFDITPDFESIYTALEALTDPHQGVKKAGAFAAYITHKANLVFDNRNDKQSKFRDILRDFRQLIYKECTIQKGVIERKRAVFDRLFHVTSGYNENRSLPSITGTVNATDVQVPAGHTVVTTNYDMAVELYHRWTEQRFTDGFKTTQKEYTKGLDFSEFGRNETSRWLIKLHGSIWQFKENDDSIQTIADPESLPLDISVGEQMMIYPVGEKPILSYPYFDFYYLFREQPWQNLIAIGHSFRDEPINVTILERLRTEAALKTKLIVINPHAEEVVKNIGLLEASLDDKIIRINEHFSEDKMLFEKIGAAISSKGWKDYQRITEG